MVGGSLCRRWRMSVMPASASSVSKLARRVALVTHQDLTGAVQISVEGDHVQRGVAFVGLRASEGVSDGQPGWCGDEMESQSQKNRECDAQ